MMSLVWELDLPDSEKLVLLALADCANDEGHCWPGMTALKKKCSKSDRTVQAAIRTLCVKGHLTRREVLGKGCNYTVHPIVRLADPRTGIAPEEISPPKGTTQTPEAASGKPSRTINTEAKASIARIIDRWNDRSKGSGIPTVRVLNHSRSQMLAARLKEHGETAMLEAVDNVHDSEFCRGLKGDGRKADIMLILQPKTLPRVLERFYNQDDKTVGKTATPAQQIENLKKSIEFFTRVGRRDDVLECRRRIAALEGQQASPVANLVEQVARGLAA